MKMPFGKYKGRELDELPLHYLNWLYELDDVRDPLRTEIEKVIESRKCTSKKTDVKSPKTYPSYELKPYIKEIIDSGFHQAAFKHHPDKGGTNRDMQMLSMARAWLQRFVLGEER